MAFIVCPACGNRVGNLMHHGCPKAKPRHSAAMQENARQVIERSPTALKAKAAKKVAKKKAKKK